MSKYRNRLPQLGSAVFLTDGGLETTLLFHDGVELPLLRGIRSLEERRRACDLAPLFR
jgi:homocysteine S-methyltransferase